MHLSPDLEKQLAEVAAEAGCGADELAQDVIAGYLRELADVRNLLDSRYEDIKSGKVKLIPGDAVFARLRAKSEARGTTPGT